MVKRTAAAAGTLLAIAAGCWVLARAPVALTLTALALLLAVALDRAVAWLERHHWRRGLAILAVMLGVVAVLSAVVLLIVPPAVDQIGQLADEAPSLLDKLRHSGAGQFVEQHLHRQLNPASIGKRLAGPALALLGSALGAIAGLVTVLFIVIFMLASGRRLVWTALARSRPSRREVYARTLRHVYDALGGYVAGLFGIVLINGVLAGSFLAILGVPYAVPLAIVSGLSSLVPYVGAIFAGALLAGIAWASKGLVAGIATVAYYVVYQQVENHLIGPMMYRRTVHLNPLVVLLSVLFFANVLGLAGGLVAVPIAATAQIVLGEIFRARRERLHLPKVEPGPALLEEGEPPHAH